MTSTLVKPFNISPFPSWVPTDGGIPPDIYMNFSNGDYWGRQLSDLTYTRALASTNLLPSSASGASFTTYTGGVMRIMSGIGFLVEEQRTNLFLHSAAAATQNISLTSGSTYTAWINGSGSLAVAAVGGAGTITGSPATNGNPCTIVCTSTGTFSFTPSGTVIIAQVELGAFGTSYIPTTGSTAQRNADNITVTVPPTFGSAYSLIGAGITYTPLSDVTPRVIAEIYDGSTSNRLTIFKFGSDGTARANNSSGGPGIDMIGPVWTEGTLGKFAVASTNNDQSFSFNGGTPITSPSLPFPIGVNQFIIGRELLGDRLDGIVTYVGLWATYRISNTAVQNLTM